MPDLSLPLARARPAPPGRPGLLLLALAVGAAGCALLRPDPSADERVRQVALRLDEAPSDSARRAVAVGLLTSVGLTPLAGARFEYGPAAGPVVAGFVPGRVPVERDTLVVVAAGLSGPEAAVVAEAARWLVESAARNEGPDRSVLVALWGPGRTAAEGLADVLAFPLWPPEAVVSALVVGPSAPPPVAWPSEIRLTSVTPDGASAAGLAARVHVLAARPSRPDSARGDSIRGAPVQSPAPLF